MTRATDKHYNQAIKIIRDNWDQKEAIIVTKIKTTLNVSEKDSQDMYNHIVDNIVSQNIC